MLQLEQALGEAQEALRSKEDGNGERVALEKVSVLEGELEEERSKHRSDVQELEEAQETALQDLNGQLKENTRLEEVVERLKAEMSSLEASSSAAVAELEEQKKALGTQVMILEQRAVVNKLETRATECEKNQRDESEITQMQQQLENALRNEKALKQQLQQTAIDHDQLVNSLECEKMALQQQLEQQSTEPKEHGSDSDIERALKQKIAELEAKCDIWETQPALQTESGLENDHSQTTTDTPSQNTIVLVRRSKLETCFRQIDMNGDGKLEYSELRAVFGEDASEFIKFCDVGAKDGVLTCDEFVEGIILDAERMSDEE